MKSQNSTSKTEQKPNRMPESSDVFSQFMLSNWEILPKPTPTKARSACYTQTRRKRLSALFPSQRIIIYAGWMKTRANDTHFLFRADSSFVYFTGWTTECVPGAVLVFEPVADSKVASDCANSGVADMHHEVTLYFAESAGRDSDEFWANHSTGEFWTGPRPSCQDVAVMLDIPTAPISHFLEKYDKESLKQGLISVPPTECDFEHLSIEQQTSRELKEAIDTLRLIKDKYEIDEIRNAINISFSAYENVLKALPRAIGHPKGERIVETAFNAYAREHGHLVGYNSICAAGEHACILHWESNNGPICENDLLLLDAGVEVESFYTADITRTFPVSGRFTHYQKQIYEAVLQAADCAIAMVRPGRTLSELNTAALTSLAESLDSLGLLTQPLDEVLKPENMFHRRYMVHGLGHHLGLDVHDCASLPRTPYMHEPLQPGMVFTVEPGLYFQSNDLTVPKEYRGIGVRLEDDILVTEEGCENLSQIFPRTARDIEEWVVQCSSAAL